MLLEGYPDGSDITLLDTTYIYPKKQKNGKWDDGHLVVLIKDNIKNKKKIIEIDNPDYEYYMSKDGIPVDHNMLFEDVNKLDRKIVPFKDLEKQIAKDTGNINFYWDNIKNGNRSLNKKLHTHPKVFFSDMCIDENFRWRFRNHYTDKLIKIKKGFFDIEVDGIHQKGDFPELGECPVNAVTIIFNEENLCYTFLLRNKENPLIEEFEKSIGPDTFARLRELIRIKIGGRKNEIRYGLDKLQFKFLFYNEENEINLLVDLFRLINYKKYDFLMAWNMRFDVPYILERIKILGYNPEEVLCPKEIKNKHASYYIDEKNNDKINKRGDFAKITSYTMYIDQLNHFMGRRKSTNFKNGKLDYIGSLIGNMGKLDYSSITTVISKLPYLNYEVFVFYNILDVINQKCIEHKTDDVTYVFTKCLLNDTQYHKCHMQSVYIVNRIKTEFYKDGFILGNNINRYKPKPLEKYPGAFVANIRRLSPEPKMKINGVVVDIVNNCIDFDFKSLYPSTARYNNIAHNTQIGRVLIDNKIYKNENRFKDDKWSRSMEFIENFQPHQWLEFGTRWLNLGSYEELYDDIVYYFTNIKSASLYYPTDVISKNIPMFVPCTKSDLFMKDNEKIPLFTNINKDNIDLNYYKGLVKKENHIWIEEK